MIFSHFSNLHSGLEVSAIQLTTLVFDQSKSLQLLHSPDNVSAFKYPKVGHSLYLPYSEESQSARNSSVEENSRVWSSDWAVCFLGYLCQGQIDVQNWERML